MTAQILDGEALARAIRAELAVRIEGLADRGITPGLGTLLVGDDPASHKYVAMKHDDCGEIGMASADVRLGADASDDDVRSIIRQFNERPDIDACLLQYPFPAHLNYEALLLEVDPAKDADGLHPISLGQLVLGAAAPRACTPAGIQRLLEAHDVPLAGAHVVIVGRGLTIGRPLANLLTLKHGANSAVTVVHTGVSDIAPLTLQADVLVVAAGSPGIITADMVKPGAAVVAAGVTYVDGRATSDVADDVSEVAGWLSPRIGGVGPMTRAMLLSNVVDAAGG